jgi:hypothetical protein
MNARTPADTVADELIADMERLGRRPYAEVGVPMFLVAEDRRASTPPAVDVATQWRDVATLFADRAEVLIARKPDLGVSDVARLVEVFADRYLIASAVPPFSMISDEPAERSRDLPASLSTDSQ